MASTQLGTVLLSDLDPTRKRVTVCVRVSRMWDYIKDNKLAHVDLVLIDENGNKIHAKIAAMHAEKFKELLRENGVYLIRDFLVQLSQNMFRAVEGNFMIKMTPWTKVQPAANIPPAFPKYAYSLTDFEQLPELVGRKEKFIDVIGILTAISDLLNVRLPGQPFDSPKRNLKIMDIHGSHMDVALWGDNAANFDADGLYRTGQTEAVIVLLVGTLMKSYLTRDTISCGHAAKYYINPDIPEKREYCERLGKHLPLVRWMKAEDDLYHKVVDSSKPEEVTVGHLLSTDPNEYIGRNMLCTVTIVRLQSTSWWYLACSKCHKTAYPARTQFVCSDRKCHSIRAGPRYKVHVIGADKTGETEFVFFAGVAEQIVGKKVDTLASTARSMPDSVPAEIAAFVSQRFTLNISLSERGLEFGELSFQVNSINAIYPNSKVFEFCTLLSYSGDAPSALIEFRSSAAAPSDNELAEESQVTVHACTESVIPDTSNDPADPAKLTDSSQVPSTPASVTRPDAASKNSKAPNPVKDTRKRPATCQSKPPAAKRALFDRLRLWIDGSR